MSLGLSILKPALMPLVKFLVGKLVTQELMRHVIDIVFANAHAVVDQLPTHGQALTAIEKNVDKDALAKQLEEFLESQL